MKRVAFQLMMIAGIGVALQFTGCHSAKPPPPVPQAVSTAERTASQAEKYSKNSQWPAAAKEWKRAADQYGLLNNQAEVAIAWHNLGAADAQLENFPEAMRWLEQAASLNEKLGLKEEWWRNQISLLQVEAVAKETNALNKRMETLHGQATQLKNPSLQGLFLNELGLWEQSRGEMGKAATAFQQAEQQFVAGQNAAGIATVQANQARLQEAQTNWTAALQNWQAALKKFEVLADPPGITAALAGLGRTCLEIKDYTRAEDYLRRALRNYRTLNKETELARTMALLKNALNAQGKEAEAKALDPGTLK